jgi:ribosome-associated protein
MLKDQFSSDLQELAEILEEQAHQFEAEDVFCHNAKGQCPFADFFVVMTLSSTMRLNSMAEKLMAEAKSRGLAFYGAEGLQAAEWVVLDFVDVIVHLMLTEKRLQYDLSTLWQQFSRPTVE